MHYSNFTIYLTNHFLAPLRFEKTNILRLSQVRENLDKPTIIIFGVVRKVVCFPQRFAI